MIRVLVIDDSPFMRKAISLMISRDPGMEVIGTARDGEDGFHKTIALKPDLVTLDIEMPRTDGLSYIEMTMRERPTPILVVSSLTTKGAEVTLKALALGAVDYLPKSQSRIALDISQIESELRQKIKAIVHCRGARYPASVNDKSDHQQEHASPQSGSHYDLHQRLISCVTIGVSTGGPPVLQTILSALPAAFPAPILIAQHMPEEFTKTFAKRLDSKSELTIKEAENGEIIVGGHVYIGRGGQHISIASQGPRTCIQMGREPSDLLYHPSADVLFESAAHIFGKNSLGLILTGMGKDGVQGLLKMKEKGAVILAQNEASCAVYGMPRAAVKAGVVSQELTVNGLIKSMQTLLPIEGANNG